MVNCTQRTLNPTKRDLICELPYAVAAIFIVIISLTVCWLGDDIDYMFRIHDSIWNSWGGFSSPSDFLDSQINHYLHVNGRGVAHAIVQLFCGILGQTTFAICNGVVWFLFLRLIFETSVGKRSDFSASMTVTVVALLTFITKMMPTTQIGYIWMFALTLWWLRLYRSERMQGVWGTALLTLLGMVAGNGQEALSIGVCGMLGADILFTVIDKRQGRRLSLRLLLPAIGFVVGTATDCLSPSTIQRAAAGGGDGMMVSDSVIFMLIALRAFYLMAAVWLLRWCGRRERFRQLLKENGSLLFGIGILLVFNFLIGVKSNRQLFGVELLSMVILIRILPGNRFSVLPIVLLTGSVIGIYSVQIYNAVQVRREVRDIEKEYCASENGTVYRTRVRVSSHPITREIRLFEDVTGRFDNDVRHSMLKLFHLRQKGKKVLRFLPEEVRPDSVTGKISADVLRDTVIETAPGHFLIMTSEENPQLIFESRNCITGNVRIDTVVPPRPVAFLKIQDGTIRRYYEVSPDKALRIDKFLLNSQIERK